jgi:phage baseplate assembly protein V
MAGAEFKRGTVKENDPKKARSRVEVTDEDGSASYWLAWNMSSAGASKMYSQPDVGSQVNVLFDRHGEDGIILGARYSDQDQPPTQNGALVKALMEGGGDVEYNKGNGQFIIKMPGGVVIETPLLIIRGEVQIVGPKVTHNGHDIGDTQNILT